MGALFGPWSRLRATLRAAAAPVILALLPCSAALAQVAAAEPGLSRVTFRLKWLVDLGAESLAASSPASAQAGALMVSVPGAAYVFEVAPDGSLTRKLRLAADPAAPYGVAGTDLGLALANQQGSVSLWNVAPGGGLSLGWRRDLGERVTSVAWGGETVFVATWRNRLLALSAGDGRIQWTADIGGRAEAPATVDGKDVFVATKARALLRLDAVTGRVRWKVELPGLVLHPPVILGETPRLVVCGIGDGRLIAHDPTTGRVRWTVSLPAKLAGAPLGGPELVFSVTADGSVHAHDAAGAPRWMQANASEGGASLVRPVAADPSPRLIVVSKTLVALDLATGQRLADYPKGAAEDLKRRFADAMLDGVKTYSEGEKRALLEREAFDIAGPLFGPARLVGRHLSFGTEEAWAYLFDSSTLRPLGRYHAGRASTGVAQTTSGRVLAVAGEEIFGVDPLSGRALWQRTIGPDAGDLSGGVTPGIVAGGQISALDPADGLPRWSLRGRFRSTAPPPPDASDRTPWLADDGDGNLRAVWPGGRLDGATLPAGGELLPIQLGSSRWVAATREGKVFAVSWEEAVPGAAEGTGASQGHLVALWERDLGGRLAELRVAPGRIAVRTESGSLVGLDEQGQELWRLPLAVGERFEMVPQASALLISGAADLRVHGWTSGEARFQWKTVAPAVAADIRGGSLLWVDAAGGAFQVEIAQGRVVEAKDLGIPLARASATRGGFLVTTAGGELGFVEVATDHAGPGGSREQAGVDERFGPMAERGGEP